MLELCHLLVGRVPSDLFATPLTEIQLRFSQHSALVTFFSFFVSVVFLEQ